MILVVFDIDGTLTNTKAIDDQCYLQSVKACWGCDLGEVDWSTYQNVTDTGLATDIYRAFFNEEVPEAELRKLKRLFSSAIIKASKINPNAFREINGAAHFFQKLQAGNVGVAIATGGWKVTAAHKLKLIGLDLDQLPHATSDDHYSRTEILLKSIERAKEHYKNEFNQIFYVGDGVWDYAASQLLTIGFIGIDSVETGKLAKAGAEKIFKDFADTNSLLEVIKRKERQIF